MIRESAMLLKIQLLTFFGINEAIHSKDSKKKFRLIWLMVGFAIMGVMLMAYSAGMAYSLCFIGAGKVVPAFLVAVTSVVIAFFTVFKAGAVIFQVKNYEMLSALPLRPQSIVISRFMTMYVGNLIMSAIILIPAIAEYARFETTSATSWIMLLLSLFLIPLIPMALATLLGVLVTAIAARIKYRNIMNVISSLVLVIVVICISYYPSFSGKVDKMSSVEMLSDIAALLTDKVNSIYPLASMYSHAVLDGSILAFFEFAFLSIGIFALFVVLVSWKYESISMALQVKDAKHNYKLQELKTGTPLSALYTKEIKRYFASNIYVINTILSYVMVLVLAVALFLAGVDQVEQTIGLPGVLEKGMPLFLGLIVSVAPITVCSISMEGKQWWIPLSLPVTTKTIFDSKLLVQYTIGLPITIIASTAISVVLKGGIAEHILVVLMPVCYVIFNGVLGITVNAKFPVFNWENETRVVKQSTATLVGMFLGMFSAIFPMAAILIAYCTDYLGESGVVFAEEAWIVVLLVLTRILYVRNNRIDLRKI